MYGKVVVLVLLAWLTCACDSGVQPMAVNTRTPTHVVSTEQSDPAVEPAPLQAVALQVSTEPPSNTPTPPMTPTAVMPLTPIRLIIPSIGFDETLVEGGIEQNGEPYAPLNDAVHYKDSRYPGQGGNIVMWAHATTNFLRVRELQKGSEIILETDGVRRSYIAEIIISDDPNKNDDLARHVFSPDEAIWPDGRRLEGERVTITTCDGTWIRNSSNKIVGSTKHWVLVAMLRG
jgi:sortase (surface protein transpeptidase)